MKESKGKGKIKIRKKWIQLRSIKPKVDSLKRLNWFKKKKNLIKLVKKNGEANPNNQCSDGKRDVIQGPVDMTGVGRNVVLVTKEIKSVI